MHGKVDLLHNMDCVHVLVTPVSIRLFSFSAPAAVRGVCVYVCLCVSMCVHVQQQEPGKAGHFIPQW